jgi:hypothetical protein
MYFQKLRPMLRGARPHGFRPMPPKSSSIRSSVKPQPPWNSSIKIPSKGQNNSGLDADVSAALVFVRRFQDKQQLSSFL